MEGEYILITIQLIYRPNLMKLCDITNPNIALVSIIEMVSLHQRILITLSQNSATGVNHCILRGKLRVSVGVISGDKPAVTINQKYLVIWWLFIFCFFLIFVFSLCLATLKHIGSVYGVAEPAVSFIILHNYSNRIYWLFKIAKSHKPLKRTRAHGWWRQRRQWGQLPLLEILWLDTWRSMVWCLYHSRCTASILLARITSANTLLVLEHCDHVGDLLQLRGLVTE